MSDKTHINWTEATLNPWHGCIKVSPGCKNCYMYREKERYGQDPRVVVRSKTKFGDPLRWKEGKLVFACSWSDWFIKEADAWRDEAWDVIRKTPQHTYQILTKRPERIQEHLPRDWGEGWANVWLGVSVESQDYAYRVDSLLGIPAALHFISAEPLLAPVIFSTLVGIGWVITGGESDPVNPRPMNPEWAMSIRDQCANYGIPYLHKQNGGNTKIDGEWGGRLLDGQIYDAIPVTRKQRKVGEE